MVDRKNVAVEKMDRAVQILKENQIDMWMFYSGRIRIRRWN